MISLAAWITVSMSALSKLRTTKRPRWAGGTGGAVGGGGGSGAGAVSGRGGGMGGTVRGPNDAGGSDGGAACARGVAAMGAGGVSGGFARWRLDAQPAATTSSRKTATTRFILLARRRQRLARRVLGNRRHPAPEAWRGPRERYRLRLSALPRLLDRLRRDGLSRHHRSSGRCKGARQRLPRPRDRREALIPQLTARRPLPGEGRLTRHPRLARRLRPQRPRLSRVPPTHVGRIHSTCNCHTICPAQL